MPYLLQAVLLGAAAAALAFALADGGTRLSIGLAHRIGALAGVNERSSHREPVPRIGGIGLLAGLFAGPILALLMHLVGDRLPLRVLSPGTGDSFMIGPMMLVATMVSMALAFALGLWDDLKDPPALAKLLGQFAIAAIPPIMGLRLERLMLPGMSDFALLPAAFSIPLTMLWILVAMNAVNFMDGINGLAARFGQLVGMFAILSVFMLVGANILIPLCMVLYGAGAGFLRYNRTPAKTFMGDCGSQPLGVYIACLGILITHTPTSYPLNFIGFLIIVSVFLFDVGFTLVRRTLAGENPMKAHRTHLYQRHLRATGEDHEGTRNFMEGYLLASGVIGTLYLYFGSVAANAAWQLLLILAALIVLGTYAMKVFTLEKNSPREDTVS